MLSLDQALEQVLQHQYPVNDDVPYWRKEDVISVYERTCPTTHTRYPEVEVFTQQRLDPHPLALPALMPFNHAIRNFVLLRLLIEQYTFTWKEGCMQVMSIEDISKFYVNPETGDIMIVLGNNRASLLKVHQAGVVAGTLVILPDTRGLVTVEIDWEDY